MSSNRLSGILKTVGPGILYAGAAIGGSHLVQSTRAGAMYGFALIWAVVLVNVFKYPFFAFVYRYTASTGETVLAGYRRVGAWTLWCYLAFTFVSGIINLAAVTAITAGLAGRLVNIQSVAGVEMGMFPWTVIILAVCLGLLLVGRYAVLDTVVKLVMVVLVISTVAAFLLAVGHGSNAQPGFEAPPLWDVAGITFLLALMGWMPTPLEGSVWPSLWAVQRRKQTGYTPTLREHLVDFHLGYVGSGVLALAFVGLGAMVMYGTGQQIETSGIKFSGQLFDMYTASLGQWSFYIVGVAAFTCMFSTTITCFDAYARVIHTSLFLSLDASEERAEREGFLHFGIMAFFAVTTLIVIGRFMTSMVGLLTVATLMAFLSAPVLAYLNYRVITHPHVPADGRAPKWLLTLAWAGMAFLTGFSLLFLYVKFVA